MDELMKNINLKIDEYLVEISTNKKTFAEVSEELRRQKFSFSKSELEVAVLRELQFRNSRNAMDQSI